MSKGLFITGTGTDIGKTYVTALLIKTLRQHGYDIGYYKAAISGAPTVAASDAGYVNATAGIGEAPDLLLSYLYDHAVSPHLAALWEHKPIEKDVNPPGLAARHSGLPVCHGRRQRRHHLSPPR